MRYVRVRFQNNPRLYTYKTKLDLIEGVQYHIKNEHGYDYRDAVVTVVDYVKKADVQKDLKICEITSVRFAKDQQVKDLVPYEIKNVYENIYKGVTTVLWTDGTVTTVKCHESDRWDREKAIAMAFVKKYYHSTGKHNREIAKWVGILEDRALKTLNFL